MLEMTGERAILDRHGLARVADGPRAEKGNLIERVLPLRVVSRIDADHTGIHIRLGPAA